MEKGEGRWEKYSGVLGDWRGYPLDEAQWIPEANFTTSTIVERGTPSGRYR